MASYWGFYFDSEPIESLRETSRTQLQAETIAQNGGGFPHGKPLGFVEIGGQSQGSWTEVHTGCADCQ